jgi:hypothetical protein
VWSCGVMLYLMHFWCGAVASSFTSCTFDCTHLSNVLLPLLVDVLRCRCMRAVTERKQTCGAAASSFT